MKIKYLFTYLIIVSVGLVFISGCKTKKIITKEEKRDLPTDPVQLGKLVIDNNSRFNVLTLSNFKVKYTEKGKTTTFYGASKLIKDSLILVSLRAPLGIEMSRILLTPDSVKMLNRTSKNAVFSDYSYLSDIVHFQVTFDIVESILSGNLPSDYIAMPRSLFGDIQRKDTVRTGRFIGRYFNKTQNNDLKYEAWVDPTLLKPAYMKFYRRRNFKLFDVSLTGYMKSGTNYYPGEIHINHNSTNGIPVTIRIMINKIEENSDNDINFSVPSRYKIIRLD